MLSKVKVFMDEQTKQMLDCLRDDFSEILAPLNQLSELNDKISEFIVSNSEISDEVRRKVSSIGNEVISIRKKTEELIEEQQDSFRKLSAALSEILEFKTAIKNINWKD